MFRKVEFTAAMVCACVALAGGPATQPSVQFSRLVERRTTDAKITDHSFFNNEQAEITMFITGPEAAAASAYRVHLDVATDDTGASLVPAVQEDRFNDVGSFEKDKLKDGAPGFAANARLNLPKRAAKKITLVKGTIALKTGGEEKVVEVADLGSLVGKDVDDATLKTAGLKFHIKAAKGPQFELSYSGPKESMRKLELVDAAGKSLSNGHGGFGMGDVHQESFNLTRDLPADAKLKITVSVGTKEMSVPFEVKDIVLP